jgi:hypothetical protein
MRPSVVRNPSLLQLCSTTSFVPSSDVLEASAYIPSLLRLRAPHLRMRRSRPAARESCLAVVRIAIQRDRHLNRRSRLQHFLSIGRSFHSTGAENDSRFLCCRGLNHPKIDSQSQSDLLWPRLLKSLRNDPRYAALLKMLNRPEIFFPARQRILNDKGRYRQQRVGMCRE